MNAFDLTGGTPTDRDSIRSEGEFNQKGNKFEATISNPHFIRVETENDVIPSNQQIFTQGRKDN
jgi:hypothetical protein